MIPRSLESTRPTFVKWSNNSLESSNLSSIVKSGKSRKKRDSEPKLKAHEASNPLAHRQLQTITSKSNYCNHCTNRIHLPLWLGQHPRKENLPTEGVRILLMVKSRVVKKGNKDEIMQTNITIQTWMAWVKMLSNKLNLLRHWCIPIKLLLSTNRHTACQLRHNRLILLRISSIKWVSSPTGALKPCAWGLKTRKTSCARSLSRISSTRWPRKSNKSGSKTRIRLSANSNHSIRANKQPYRPNKNSIRRDKKKPSVN